MRLTDVFDDCLELIFQNLSISDLFNVAVSSNCLINGVLMVFERNNGNKHFMIDPFGIRISEDDEYLSFKTSFEWNQFSFLRLFGNSISRLLVQCDVFDIENIKNYVDKYCFKSRVTLESYIFLPSDAPEETFLRKTLAKHFLRFIDQTRLAVAHGGCIRNSLVFYSTNVLFSSEASRLNAKMAFFGENLSNQTILSLKIYKNSHCEVIHHIYSIEDHHRWFSIVLTACNSMVSVDSPRNGCNSSQPIRI